MSACRYEEEISSAAMVAAERLAGVAPEVNLRECVTCTPSPRGDVTVSPKQGYQWPHEKECPPKNLKKKTKKTTLRIHIFKRFIMKILQRN